LECGLGEHEKDPLYFIVMEMKTNKPRENVRNRAEQELSMGEITIYILASLMNYS
jgi:hypothetical protein